MKIYAHAKEDFSLSLPFEVNHPSTSWAMIWGGPLSDPTGVSRGVPAGWRSLYTGGRIKELYASLKVLARYLPGRPIRAGTAKFEWRGVVEEFSTVEIKSDRIEHVVLAVRPLKHWTRATEPIGSPLRPTMATRKSSRGEGNLALVGEGAYRAWGNAGDVRCLYGGITSDEADSLGLRVATQLAPGRFTISEYQDLRALWSLTDEPDQAA